MKRIIFITEQENELRERIRMSQEEEVTKEYNIIKKSKQQRKEEIISRYNKQKEDGRVLVLVMQLNNEIGRSQ